MVTHLYLFCKIVILQELLFCEMDSFEFSLTMLSFSCHKNMFKHKLLLISRIFWQLPILKTVLKVISQSSNFTRITILRNGQFSPFVDNVFVLCLKNMFKYIFIHVPKIFATSLFINGIKRFNVKTVSPKIKHCAFSSTVVDVVLF